MDAIRPLLRHAEAARFEDLPPRVVEIVKRYVLDTLAVLAAGARAPGCRETIALLADWGGKPEAFVAGGPRLPAPQAALANALMAHALDYDDTHEPADVHAFAVVLPAVLAAAEAAGDVHGGEIVAALAVGTDIAYRMGMAINVYRGWHPTATCGVFGAALAAGRVLGLKGERLHNAAGIAYSLASGNFQCILDGSLTKRLQPAFAARAAVEAAMLAQRGVTGAKDVLEGKFGFYRLYEAGDYKRKPIEDGLGHRFEVEGASMKPYPSCRFCHPAVDAVLELKSRARVAPEQVAGIVVEMPKEAHDYVGGPFREGDSPQVSAQFNAAYNVAAALVRGRLGPQEFCLDAIRDPSVRALAERVTTVATDDAYAFGPVAVTVRLASGATHALRVETAKGHPANPMSDAERLEKLGACVAFGGWPERTAHGLEKWVRGLERNRNPARALALVLAGETVA
jgi:2-methylcitrate dehydratase PrpD